MSFRAENYIMSGLHQLNRNFNEAYNELSSAMPVAPSRIWFVHEQRGGFAYWLRVAGEG